MTPPSSRRRAIQTLAAAALAASNLPRPAASAGGPGPMPGRRMKIDLVCANLGVKATFLQAVDYASRYGFESVAPEVSYLATLDDSQVAGLLSDLYRRKIALGAAPLAVDFRGDEQTFRATLKDLPRDAQVLRRSGATRLTTWIRPADAYHTYLSNFGRHVDRLRQVALILGDHGIRLGLEYVGPRTSWASKRHPFIHTLAETRELIEAIGRTNVGVVLDSWHWYCAGETPDDIRALSGREVIACDLNDAPAGVPVDRQVDNARELPCATGVIDVKGFLNALTSIGYEGPVRAEPFNAAVRALKPEDAVAATAKAMKTAFGLVGG